MADADSSCALQPPLTHPQPPTQPPTQPNPTQPQPPKLRPPTQPNPTQQDLNSSNYLEASVALNGLSNFVNTDIARDLSADIVGMLNHSKPYIRKRVRCGGRAGGPGHDNRKRR